MDRRRFLALSLGSTLATHLPAEGVAPTQPLRSPGYHQVDVLSPPHLAQQRNALAVLNGLSDDSLLMPFRAMSGQPAPGINLSGWYEFRSTYNFEKDDAGLAPGCTFGQWTSALARLAAASNDHVVAERVRRLHLQLGQSISSPLFDQHRFPAYLLDKLVGALVDAHTLLNDATALTTLDKIRRDALPNLPGHAVEREVYWRPSRDQSFTWDESYTLPENLYLAARAGAGHGYDAMAEDYLLDTSFFDPLAQNENVLGGKHGYSHVNALCSAMQAHLTGGSAMHLRAAVNGFRMLEAQSYATGGWAPDELLAGPNVDRLYPSLTNSHNTFETPCGAYAHSKLTRYLLQATRDGHYGDSMERIHWNTALGARPLQGDGRSFYYADFSANARRIDSVHRWPCCSGTLPQLAADYGINAYLISAPPNPAVWINLYLPSRLRWQHHGTALELEQHGDYPTDDTVHLTVRVPHPTTFPLHLRIPEWAAAPEIRINGERQPAPPITLGFARLERRWRIDDTIDLRLPMQLRLEPLRSNGATPHPEIASLLWGPWVLMPLTPLPTVSSDRLLSAERVSPTEWAVSTPTGRLRLRPFPFVGDDLYSAHVRLA